MKIQVDIPVDINKKLKIYKAENDLGSLQEAVLSILTKWKTTLKN